MSLVQIVWRPGPEKLREFGVTMLVGFGLIGALLTWGVWPAGGLRHWPLGAPSPLAGAVAWAVGAAVGIPALTGAKAGLPGYWAVMGVSFLMGQVVGRAVMAAIFFGLITPMGVVMRLAGRDKLQLRGRGAATYWRDLPPPPEPTRYERQF